MRARCLASRSGSYGWLRLTRTTASVLALTLVRGCPLPADRCADLPGYRVFSMSGSIRPRTPGSIRAARQSATRIVAYRRDKTVGTHQPNFSGLNTLKVGSTRYLCTSPAYQPKHRRACYQSRRKARYWARGARLPRRDSHPLEHAALLGHTIPIFLVPLFPRCARGKLLSSCSRVTQLPIVARRLSAPIRQSSMLSTRSSTNLSTSRASRMCSLV
jgi:hypothetical protein